jgi:hypothetical protein
MTANGGMERRWKESDDSNFEALRLCFGETLRRIMEELSQNTWSLRSILTIPDPTTEQYLDRKFVHQNNKTHSKAGHTLCGRNTPVICDLFFLNKALLQALRNNEIAICFVFRLNNTPRSRTNFYFLLTIWSVKQSEIRTWTDRNIIGDQIS